MLYAPSALGVGQLSGKAGAVVASHNRYGSYLRNRVVPTNPQTDAQTDVRDFFALMSQTWRDLTESQRNAWTALSAEVPVVNRIGMEITLAGNAFFNKVNILRRQVGDAVITDAPALDIAPAALTLTPTVDATPTMSIAYTVGEGAAGNNLIFRASAPRSPGKTYVRRGELRQITAIAGNTASPLAAQSLYEAVYGTGWQTMVGMEIVFEVQGVSANGLPGSILRAITTIGPGS
jgi:hypothetical protein